MRSNLLPLLTLTPIALTLVVATPLTAQSVVSPTHFTNVEGASYTTDGLGTTTTPNRYMSIHSDLAGAPLSINRISFRRDANSVNVTNVAPFNMLCDLVLSTAATTAGAPSATFDNNHGANRQQLMSFALVSFAQTGPGRMPRLFDYTIPLPSAYAHSGSGPLCFELRVNSRTNTGAVYFDYTQGGSTNPAPHTRSFGTGCRYTATGARVTLSASSGANWSQSSITMSMNGSNVRPNTLAYMTIGVTDETLGAIPLPFELPGTAASPSGACNVYNDILITIPTLANANGQTTTNLGVGVNPSFNGLNIYSQLISADAAANNWSLVLSNGVHFQVVAPFATGRIGEVYNNASTGPTGTVRANGGMITMFH